MVFVVYVHLGFYGTTIFARSFDFLLLVGLIYGKISIDLGFDILFFIVKMDIFPFI